MRHFSILPTDRAGTASRSGRSSFWVASAGGEIPINLLIVGLNDMMLSMP
jgi:hypothetical protein